MTNTDEMTLVELCAPLSAKKNPKHLGLSGHEVNPGRAKRSEENRLADRLRKQMKKRAKKC